MVPFEIAGVKSGKTTSGHRLLGKAEVEVTIDTFADQLHANGVVLSAKQRRAMIEAGLGSERSARRSSAETLVYLTEYPSTIRGSFDRKYLELPREILSTVMRHHQRYFSVEARQRQAGAGVRRRDEYKCRSRRTRPPRERARAAGALQRCAILLGCRPAAEPRRPPGGPEERHVSGEARLVLRKDRAHGALGEADRRNCRRRVRSCALARRSSPSAI